ncbi:hypothetical protein D9M68_609370 [compost metagenome]
MWVHEGFTNYSETLFVDYHFGEAAGNAYNYGIRRGIRNDRPIIPPYNVNAQGSGDMYPKGGNLLHSIKHSLNNDVLFRSILRGLNSTFYHKTVTTAQVEQYISARAGFNYARVFDQYLRTTQIPTLEYSIKDGRLSYRYVNCVEGFNLPVILKKDGQLLKLYPTSRLQALTLPPAQLAMLSPEAIEKLFYVKVKKLEE